MEREIERERGRGGEGGRERERELIIAWASPPSFDRSPPKGGKAAPVTRGRFVVRSLGAGIGLKCAGLWRSVMNSNKSIDLKNSTNPFVLLCAEQGQIARPSLIALQVRI